MKKADIFAWTAGVIGLIADIIAITMFSIQQSSGKLSDSGSVSYGLEVVIIFLMVYGWFIFSWMLVRRFWVNMHDKKYGRLSGIQRPKQIFSHRTLFTVFGFGILLFPFVLQLPFNSRPPIQDNVEWAFRVFLTDAAILIVVGLLMWAAIMLLMPMIYSDMYRLHDP